MKLLPSCLIGIFAMAWVVGLDEVRASVLESDASTSGDTIAFQQAYDSNITAADLIDRHSETFLSQATSGFTSEAKGFGKLNDGVASSKITTNDLTGDAFFPSWELTIQPSTTFNLNLTAHPAGYDIASIKTINGWADSQTFSNQSYTVYVRQVNSTVYTALKTVDYVPFAKDEEKNPQSSSMVTLHADAEPMATNVAAIRFVYRMPSVASSGTVVREIEVNGQPSTTPAPPAPAKLPVILPLGDSITWGDQDINGVKGDHGRTPIAGGYRTMLYTRLHDAHFDFTFAGSQTTNASATLSAVGLIESEGHDGYTINGISDNLTKSNRANGNNGGYWLSGGGNTGRDAVEPDYILLEIGTNNLSSRQSVEGAEADLQKLVTVLATLRPNAKILIGSVIPRVDPKLNARTVQFNQYLRETLIPENQKAGLHVWFVEHYKNFLKDDGSVNAELLTDGTHPSQTGYDLMGTAWAEALLKLNAHPQK